MRDEVIVVLTPQQWIHPLSGNAKDYSFEFCQQNKVVYVNLPLDIFSLLKRQKTAEDKLRIKCLLRQEKAEQCIEPNLWVIYPQTVLLSINRISNRWVYNWLNKFNNYLFTKAINRSLKKLDLKGSVIFNDNLMSKGLYVKEMLGCKRHFYYIRDNFENHRYYKLNNLLDQRELVKKADAVFCNSDFLRIKALPYNINSYDVGQGSGVRKNSQVSRLPIEQFINHPVVGYLGNITTLRLDIELLKYAAQHLPGYMFLFVGPVDNDFSTSDLNDYPNVMFTGACKPEMVASFMNIFDVAINPQLINDLTIGNYPRKVDEYLLHGRPVVAVETEFMKSFEGYVYLASTPEQFCAKIKQAHQDNSPSKEQDRIKFAAKHTWPESTRKIYTIVDELEKSR